MRAIVYGCLIWLCFNAGGGLAYVIKYDAAIIEDAHLRTPGLIRKYGYKVEEHTIDTRDGFRLSAHRIPRSGGQPVLLVHGLQDSSSGWIIAGPKSGLGYLLSDRGYDVWLLNCRGNRYSRQHRKYSVFQRKFWDYSFHEIGVYDLPAAIDYVLAHSDGHDQVHYVAHSQGTSAGFVLGSERPDYMKKVKLMQALAPVAYFDNVRLPILRSLAPYISSFVRLLQSVGINEFPPELEVWRELAYKLCSFAFRNTCIYWMMELLGADMDQTNSTLVPLLLGHIPAGSSLKSLDHYRQQLVTGGFYKFDFENRNVNRLIYGSPKAPPYNLTNINCKVALYYSQNDNLVAVKDVQRLSKKLPNVVHDELIEYSKFNHLDFIFANDVKDLLYESMFRVMESVDRETL